MRSVTIGMRLVVWYGTVLAASLVVFAGIVHTSFSRNLLNEIDRALSEELAEIEAVVRQSGNRAELQQALRAGFEGHPFYEIRVATTAGEVVFETQGIANRALPVPSLDSREQLAANVALSDERHFRLASRVVDAPSGSFLIHAGDSLALYDREVRSLTTILAGSIPLLLGLALFGGFWVSRRALAPVDQLTKAAIAVSSTQFDQRVEVRNPHDELGRLAHAFNSMIERLQRSFHEMRQFTADAAHELRTPLAVLRNEAEVALHSPPSSAGYQHVLENQLEEIARLTRLTDELLFLCREDAGLRPMGDEPIRADQVLEQLTAQLQAAAQARDVELRWEGLPACQIACDTDRFKRLFFNLLDNALKYTSPGGTVSAVGVLRANEVEFVIRDTGIGIPAEHIPRICQRFYRVDPARNDEIEGTGLGLAICRSIVDSLQGSLQIDSIVGRGTTVTVRLPLAGQARSATGSERAPANTNVSESTGAPGDGVWVKTHLTQAETSALISRSA